MLHLIYLLIMFAAFSFLHAGEVKQAKDEKTVALDEESELILTPQPNWKEKESTLYRISPEATKGVKGLGIPYTFWFDRTVWNESEPLNEHAERSFKLQDGYAYGIIVTDKNQFYIDDLDDIVIKNAKQSGFEHAKIVSNERRNVNGLDVLFLHWTAVLQGINVDFLSYVFSDKEGSVFIHTYTPTFLYGKNQQSMESFLNGLTLERKNRSTNSP